MSGAAWDDVRGPGLVSGAALDDVQGPGLVSGAALDDVQGPGLVSGAAVDAVRGICGIVRGIHGPSGARGPGLGSHIGFLNHFKIFTGNF